MHELKTENCTFSVEFLRTWSPETVSQIALRDCSEEVKVEPGYIGVLFKKKKKERKKSTKRLLLIKENKVSQVNEFSAFLLWKWKSLSCIWLCNFMDDSPPGLFCPWDFPVKNTGLGCHFLLQEIFLTQGLNLGSCFEDSLFTVWTPGQPFLCMERCKSLGSLKLFLWYIPQLSGTDILYFSTLSSLRDYPQGILCLLIWQATFFIHR